MPMSGSYRQHRGLIGLMMTGQLGAAHTQIDFGDMPAAEVRDEQLVEVFSAERDVGRVGDRVRLPIVEDHARLPLWSDLVNSRRRIARDIEIAARVERQSVGQCFLEFRVNASFARRSVGGVNFAKSPKWSRVEFISLVHACPDFSPHIGRRSPGGDRARYGKSLAGWSG